MPPLRSLRCLPRLQSGDWAVSLHLIGTRLPFFPPLARPPARRSLLQVASYLSKQGGDEKPTPTSTETGQQDYTQHARALMATNQIAAHISLVTMGIVPSIESHEVSTAIRDYAKFDEDEMLAGRYPLSHESQCIRGTLPPSLPRPSPCLRAFSDKHRDSHRLARQRRYPPLAHAVG